MAGRLYWGWWIYYTAWSCVDVYWMFGDTRHHNWTGLAVDSILMLLFFLLAHFAWEKGYYEE